MRDAILLVCAHAQEHACPYQSRHAHARYRRLKVWTFISLRSVNRTYAYAHWWSKIHYRYGEKCSKTCIKWQGLLPFIYRHNYGYFSGWSYCTQALGCCSIFIALQQLKVFLFPYTTNTFKAAEKVRIAPGHTSWWSSNWLNDHALSRLYRACFRVCASLH